MCVHLAGNRYIVAVAKRTEASWLRPLIGSGVTSVFVMAAAAVLVWQYPRLRQELAAWQLKNIKNRYLCRIRSMCIAALHYKHISAHATSGISCRDSLLPAR